MVLLESVQQLRVCVCVCVCVCEHARARDAFSWKTNATKTNEHECMQHRTSPPVAAVGTRGQGRTIRAHKRKVTKTKAQQGQRMVFKNANKNGGRERHTQANTRHTTKHTRTHTLENRRQFFQVLVRNRSAVSLRARQRLTLLPQRVYALDDRFGELDLLQRGPRAYHSLASLEQFHVNLCTSS
jgi:hypothetical protein